MRFDCAGDAERVGRATLSLALNIGHCTFVAPIHLIWQTGSSSSNRCRLVSMVGFTHLEALVHFQFLWFHVGEHVDCHFVGGQDEIELPVVSLDFLLVFLLNRSMSVIVTSFVIFLSVFLLVGFPFQIFSILCTLC